MLQLEQPTCLRNSYCPFRYQQYSLLLHIYLRKLNRCRHQALSALSIDSNIYLLLEEKLMPHVVQDKSSEKLIFLWVVISYGDGDIS